MFMQSNEFPLLEKEVSYEHTNDADERTDKSLQTPPKTQQF